MARCPPGEQGEDPSRRRRQRKRCGDPARSRAALGKREAAGADGDLRRLLRRGGGPPRVEAFCRPDEKLPDREDDRDGEPRYRRTSGAEQALRLRNRFRRRVDPSVQRDQFRHRCPDPAGAEGSWNERPGELRRCRCSGGPTQQRAEPRLSSSFRYGRQNRSSGADQSRLGPQRGDRLPHHPARSAHVSPPAAARRGAAPPRRPVAGSASGRSPTLVFKGRGFCSKG